MSEIILVKFFVNNTLEMAKKIRKDLKLSELREYLKFKIKVDFSFLSNDKSELSIEDEDDIIVNEILEDSKIYLKSNNMNTSNKIVLNSPREGTKYLFEKNNLKIYLYNSDQLTPEEESNAIVFMVVGQTGSGKTTFLNAFINHILGIKYEDDFRYYIIFEKPNKSQCFSQTSEVSIYNIKAPDGTIFKIIDTPGFGDYEGVKKDNEISQKIKEALKDKINYINCLCIVASSSNTRLTINQKNIFNTILDLFGNDIKNNILFLFTFCDGKKPYIIGALESKESIFNEIIPYLENPWFYKFNNYWIFENDLSNHQFNKFFYLLCKRSFEDFENKIKKFKKISLDKTKEVFLKRENLKTNIENLDISLEKGIETVNQIKNIISNIKHIKHNLNYSKNYSMKVKKYIQKKIPINDKKFITTCLVCSSTCHENCDYNNDEKWRCSIMTGDKINAHCTVCRGKCHWTKHKNLTYIIKIEEIEEIVTLDSLKNLYYDSKNNLDMKTQLLQNAKKDLIQIYKDCLYYQDLIIKCVDRLKEIALNKNNFGLSEEYIDYLIEGEKREKYRGYEKRIEGLLLLKKEKHILKEIYEKKNNNLIDIGKFIEDNSGKEEKLKDENETNCNIF